MAMGKRTSETHFGRKRKNRHFKSFWKFVKRNSRFINYVVEKLKIFWSPELIAGRMRLDLPSFRISHEAINQRLELGHWEGDSMVSRANSVSLHALLERKSRLLKLTKILRNSSECVRNAVIRKLSLLKKSARQSITYDNGPENSNHLEINRELKTQSFFCNPYHSWEKGSVENSIGLVRRFLPKKTDLQKISTTEISQIENLINNRPKKCLNYQTPKEVFKTLSGAIAG